MNNEKNKEDKVENILNAFGSIFEDVLETVFDLELEEDDEDDEETSSDEDMEEDDSYDEEEKDDTDYN
jgi:hypothetical protein